MGGGDLKFAAAAATWVGIAGTPRYLVTSAILGAALALYCYVSSGAIAQRAIRMNVSKLHAPDLAEAREMPGEPVLVPYGAAFAIGALATLWMRGLP
jgi:Flp pilus assembly protein protease CpaA